jgi:acyl-CoA synthetase (AMP-forming)/AMP-acid ligase II
MVGKQIGRQANASSDAPAISTPDRTVSYRQLAHHAGTVAQRLAATNLAAGEPVGIVMTSTPGAAARLLGTSLSGHPAVLLPPSMPESERVGLLDLAGVRVLLPETEDEAPIFRPGSTQDVTAELPPDGFICQLTSGSLGPSRLALRTDAAVAAEMEAVRQRLQLGPDDRVLCASSIAHSYGLIGGLLTPLSVAARVGLAADADQAVVLTASFRPTVIVGLAATYRAMLTSSLSPDALSSTRLTLSAGAPLAPELFGAFHDRFGLPIRQDYGTTETGTISVDTSREVLPGCAGEPLAHMEVQLASPQDIPLEGAEQGEILVRSSAVAAGYLWDGAVRSALDSAGWYHTTDAGWIDEAGRLWVGRRLRKPIVFAGLKVYPDEAERAIQALPGVLEAVVLPAAGPNGPAIKAIVVAPSVDAATLRARSGELFPGLPLVVEQVDALPRSPAGKILQKYLR